MCTVWGRIKWEVIDQIKWTRLYGNKKVSHTTNKLIMCHAHNTNTAQDKVVNKV